ncbi:hypothetical protein [Actinacidiphila oryziradicis]|uniref:Uncharacterized protein n=1 Tax=Actinacidiphila oryziradicis TaxID=2571141 RepID=A0A4U0RLP3_9ACTN|nr:hypothetical protein [Actinacidiphila oryziradicis]TJZ96753.1 hypothetical protein FCI23_50590 [Actinacidiphila oryziradicis]
MDTATVVLTIVSIVTGRACLLAGLWLRLRWRTRHEQVQRQHLTSVTESIAGGGHLEVVERRPDGHSVRIKITRSPGGNTAA